MGSLRVQSAVVYIALLGDGTRVWRPVNAILVADGIYRLAGQIPEGESWQFAPGSVVRCMPHVFSDGEHGLVTVERL